jgi:hypothetical protein
LVFGESTSNSEGAIAIGKMLILAQQNLEIFHMSAIRCGTSQYMKNPLLGGHAIAESLLKCTQMRHLNISDNSFRGCHDTLAKAIAKMPCLQVLNVKDIILTDEGVDAVLRALNSSKPPLEELHLGHNNLSPKGLPRLRAALTAVSDTLNVLSFCGAEDLENQGAVMVGKGLQNVCPLLEVLDMSECFLTRRGALALITSALTGKKHLKRLGLDGNRISDVGLEELEMMLGSFGYPDGDALMGSMEENEDDEESDPEEELDEEYEYEVFPEDVVPVTVGFGASPGGMFYSGTFTVAPSAVPAAFGASTRLRRVRQLHGPGSRKSKQCTTQSTRRTDQWSNVQCLGMFWVLFRLQRR